MLSIRIQVVAAPPYLESRTGRFSGLARHIIDGRKRVSGARARIMMPASTGAVDGVAIRRKRGKRPEVRFLRVMVFGVVEHAVSCRAQSPAGAWKDWNPWKNAGLFTLACDLLLAVFLEF
jgi:hypothetical protein